jgi:hypothetical protein
MEQRRYLRYACSKRASVRVFPAGEPVEGALCDLTEDGVRLAVGLALATGDLVGLEVPDLLEGASLKAVVEVRWTDGREFGGIIRGATPRGRARLQQVVHALSQRAHDEPRAGGSVTSDSP